MHNRTSERLLLFLYRLDQVGLGRFNPYCIGLAESVSDLVDRGFVEQVGTDLIEITDLGRAEAAPLDEVLTANGDTVSPLGE